MHLFPEGDTCHCCNKTLDVQCVHAGCCAKAEATRGHYAIARTIFQVAKTIDPSTTKEEVATGSDRLRPGGIATGTVIDGHRVAIDVGVASQAQRPQGGPIRNYVNLKLNTHRHVIDHEFRNEGISFRAAVWSQEGRPGRDAREVIDGLARHTEK